MSEKTNNPHQLPSMFLTQETPENPPNGTIDLFTQYTEELTDFDAIFTLQMNLTISSHQSDEMNIQTFTLDCDSGEYVEFVDGVPANFVKYTTTLIIGSNRTTDHTNQVDLIDPFKCYFYSDFFRLHPSTLKMVTSPQPEPYDTKIALEKGIWNIDQLGTFQLAHIGDLLHPTVKFSHIPSDTILQIKKSSQPIDISDPESLLNLRDFLVQDRKKLEILENTIRYYNEKMRCYLERMTFERDQRQIALDKMYKVRGGTPEIYHSIMEDCETKIARMMGKIA